MAWIILGHTCIIAFKYSDNMELRKVVEKEFLFQTISNGAFSVDTFFFISGFLVSFIYFRTNAKGKLEKLSKGVNEFTAGALHFFGLVVYRFIRLTAPYLYVLGIVEITMKYFASNSIFDPPTLDHVRKTFLFTNRCISRKLTFIYCGVRRLIVQSIGGEIYFTSTHSFPYKTCACFGHGTWLMTHNFTLSAQSYLLWLFDTLNSQRPHSSRSFYRHGSPQVCFCT